MKKVLFSVVLFLLLVSCCSGLCEIVTAGNSFNSSLQITIGNEYTCQLKASAKDYFRFATEKESGFYYFTLRNNNVDGPLYIEILDEAGIRIGRTRSYKNEQCMLCYKLQPLKIYYCAIYADYSNSAGKYRLTSSYALDSEPDALENGQTIRIGDVIDGAINGWTDVDFFCFATQKEPAFYSINLKNNNVDGPLYLELLDDAGIRIGRTRSYKNELCTLCYKLQPERIYYCAVYADYSNSTGKYRLTSSYALDLEPDALEDGQTIRIGDVIDGAINGWTDVDFFCFATQKESAFYNINLKNNNVDGPLYLEIQDEAGIRIGRTRSYKNEQSTLCYKLQPERIYYCAVYADYSNSTGKYRLTSSLILDPEPDKSSDALFLVAGTETAGNIVDKNDVDCFIAIPDSVQNQNTLKIINTDGDYLYVTISFNDYAAVSDYRIGRGKSQTWDTSPWNESMTVMLKGTGGNYVVSFCAPGAHKASELKTTIESTCTSCGEAVNICQLCNTVIETIVLDKLPHNAAEDWQVVAEPTCLNAGLRIQKCLSCGEELSSESIAKIEHHPTTVAIRQATCTTDGLLEQRCEFCSTLLASETIPAIGHTADKWVDLKQATCTAEGLRVLRCSVCEETLKEEVVKPLGHSPMDWQETREAQCEQSGRREKFCSICGISLETEEISALGHSYSEWVTTIEATKQVEGEKSRHCIHCGDTQFEKIDKIPKVFGIF